MGILDFIKKQFVDVIDWVEDAEDTLVFRYPMQDREIQNGGVLTVRDSQMALFVNEGQIADLFGPGKHTLTTQTLPIITNLNNLDKALQSPFKSDVYFFSTRLKLDQKWGTPAPVTVRDVEFGALRIRAFGIYSYHILDPKKFYKEVSGTRDRYTTTDLEGQLRATVVTIFSNALATINTGFVDLAGKLIDLSKIVAQTLTPEFERLGLKLDGFQVQNLSLPEEVQKSLDARAQIKMTGVKDYTQLQAADSLKIAAANPGGVAGAGAGLGAGIALGQAMAQSLTGSANGGSTQAEDPVQQIEKLHQLLQKGIITQSDFDIKKAELLKKIS